MTARLEPVRHPDEEQAEALAATLHAPDGATLNVFATLAHLPRLLRRINALGGYFMAHGSVGFRDREIAILRTAAHARSDYEIAQHRWLGGQAGLSEEEIDRVLSLDAGAESFPPGEAELVALADELALTGTLSDDGWDALGERFDVLQRVELLTLVGFYRMLGGVLNGLRVEVEDSVE